MKAILDPMQLRQSYKLGEVQVIRTLPGGYSLCEVDQQVLEALEPLSPYQIAKALVDGYWGRKHDTKTNT
jgi:hypothetical protein